MFLSDYRHRVDMLRSWASHDAATYQAFVQTVTSFGHTPHQGKRVLDIGCGANAPMTLMLHSAGMQVVGLDGEIGYRWGLGFRPSRYYRYAKEVGLAKTARKVLGEIVYDRVYYRTLAEVLQHPLTEEGLDLREANAERLPFEDSSFDLVHSNATWEHLPNVRVVNDEVARVLRPGGIAYLEIHLFPSLSGGHDLPWIVPGRIELRDVLPWRHLRDPSWTPPVYLNRLREDDYRRLFEQTEGVEIVDWKTEFTEGEELITDDLLEELRTYTKEELTKRSIVVVLRKKVAKS